MLGQVSRLAETLLTHVTLIRLLSRVGSLMSFQVRGTWKHLVAQLTSIFPSTLGINGSTFNHWTTFTSGKMENRLRTS